MSSSHRRHSRSKRRDFYIYGGLIVISILLAFGIRLASEFTMEINFMFLALIILLLIGAIVVIARKSN